MKVLNSIEEMRDQTRLLHQRIDTVKDHAEIRDGLKTVASSAHELATSLQSLAKAQGSDAKNHLNHAATLLEAAALTAKTASATEHADPKPVRTALRNSARGALQSISLAVAAQRAHSRKRSA